MTPQQIFFTALGLIALKLAAQWYLELLNRRHLTARQANRPEALRRIFDDQTFQRSVDYTLAQIRFNQVEIIFRSVTLIALLAIGFFPAIFNSVVPWFQNPSWGNAAAILLSFLILGALNLPLDWWSQFRLEEKFGFNTTTPTTWWMDRIKGLALVILIGGPLLLLILKLIEYAGFYWWIWAALFVFSIQIFFSLVAPIWILPLFNKLTPLEEGELKQRLFNLSQRANFQTSGIQVMDGSRRSRHSNAFFTGLGRWRRIILFDTLLQQLQPVEVEAVLAHEIGHYKKRHVPQMILYSGISLLAGFYLVNWVLAQEKILEAFGFAGHQTSAALLLVGLLSGTLSFWISPFFNAWLRHFEYQADEFASRTLGKSEPLIAALCRLSEKNLSNLLPHPLYSAVYYSHPTLLEREEALQKSSRTNI